MNPKTIVRSVCVAAFILLAGCSGVRSSIMNGGKPPATATPGVYAPPIEVVRADGTSVTLEYATISKLPLQLLKISGKDEQGPTVPDFLRAADVTDFTQVTFTGLDNRTLTFAPDQLSDEIILALREHPRAVNLMSPNIPDTQWVLHVFKVEVK